MNSNGNKYGEQAQERSSGQDLGHAGIEGTAVGAGKDCNRLVRRENDPRSQQRPGFERGRWQAM